VEDQQILMIRVCCCWLAVATTEREGVMSESSEES